MYPCGVERRCDAIGRDFTRYDAMRCDGTRRLAMCCEAALYVCAVPEYLEMAMRDYLAILRDITRCYAISCAVTRRVPPKGL